MNMSTKSENTILSEKFTFEFELLKGQFKRERKILKRKSTFFLSFKDERDGEWNWRTTEALYIHIISRYGIVFNKSADTV